MGRAGSRGQGAWLSALLLWTAGCGGAATSAGSQLKALAALAVPSNLAEAHAQWVATLELVEQAGTEVTIARVTLDQLGPDMARFQGDPRTDFLLKPVTEDGTLVDFNYVTIGWQAYDDLIHEIMLAKATVFQAVRTLASLSRVVGQIRGTEVAVDGSLRDQVAEVIVRRSGHKALREELTRLRQLAKACAVIVPRLRVRIAKLQVRARRLVDGSQVPPAALTLVLRGSELVSSVGAGVASLEQTLAWAEDVLPWILTFGREAGGQHPELDLQNGRLDRAELAAMLYDPPTLAP